MDIFMPLAICVIIVIIFTICGWCCKRKREGTVYGFGPSVTVTTTTTQPTQSPMVVPPYPIDARHPTPHVAAPGMGFAAHQPPYPTQPAHPTPYNQTVTHYGPLPPPMGITGYPTYNNGAHHYPAAAPYPPTVAPYPPAAAPYPPTDYNAHPPPYDVAVASPPPGQPALQKEGYGKQAPYNPHYN
ncbi:unnamed protein product [Phaedon cochleariae]|uniref:Uncharacterized protein n=1 Tax=Phaedon cochleariae TaxID=80249 RepID=A0A9N9SG41_PHACE|nr:unnamed protein product [Phaedon cochleariae]